jgi:hypothetical protein
MLVRVRSPTKYLTYKMASITDGALGRIESVGGGWYRCTSFGVDGTTGGVQIFPSNNSLGAGTTNGNILIWKCQYESGDIATDYIATTTAAVSVGPVANLPRLDYLGSSCPRLLLEPQRTNLATYSEQANQYTKIEATIGSNVLTSPDGYTNADSLIEDGTTDIHAFYNFGLTTFTAAAYTASIFAKKGGRDWFALQLYHGSNHIAYFNLNTGAVGTITAGATATITNYGNGWYRCTITATTTANAGGIAIYSANADNSITYAGTNGLAAGYFYGLQLELGAYATSYIPTLGSAVTRGWDAASKTGISSLIGQTEGTIFIDTNLDTISGQTNDPVLIHLKGSGVETYIEIYDTGFVSSVHYNSGTQASISAPVGTVVAGRNKFAFTYKQNDFALYINGVLIGTDTSGTVGAQSEFGFQYYNTNYNGQQKVNQVLLFKTRLSNSSLAELTSL